MKLGFIGAGNMGYAMLKGCTSVFGNNLVYTDVNKNRLEEIKEELGLEYALTNQDVINRCDMIVLAIKPQFMAEVLFDLSIDSTKIIITIAPGLSIDHVSALISGNPRIVRAMPNTPALVGAGMSAIAFSMDAYTTEERKIVFSVFESFGKAIELPENLMDAVVPVSGSSPAYVYMFIEALADGAVLQGISRDKAYELAAQSVLGAAKMVLDTKIHPGVLKDQVCSPGGTTIEAVRVLEKSGFRSAVIEAMDACYQKTLKFKNK
jgi:pyrroline-5-carboxylate reductase